MGLGSREWTAAVVHLSPVEEDAAAGVEEAGFTRLHTAVIIILLQIPNSTLFFCFLVDRLTGLMKVKLRASENGRFHIFCVFFPSPTSLKRHNNETCLLQLHLPFRIIRPRILFTPSDFFTYPRRSSR